MYEILNCRHDFLHNDVAKWYPELQSKVKIVLVEAAGNILGTFHGSLVTYVSNLLASRNVKIMTKTSVVKIKSSESATGTNSDTTVSVGDKTNIAVLNNNQEIPFSMMVRNMHDRYSLFCLCLFSYYYDPYKLSI